MDIQFALFFMTSLLAIVAAVAMLISDNAVHSALFLVLNFACVAFLYLMLDAAFLAMIQVSVYAGAIMVLFMFVIMLLGAERLQPEQKPRFPWLMPLGVGLTVIFLLVAGTGILESELWTEEPEPLTPVMRVVNVLSNYEAVDVTLNGEPLAEDLAFRDESELKEVAAGEYEVDVAVHGEGETPLTVTWLTYSDPMQEMNMVEQVNEELADAAPTPILERGEPRFTLEGNSDLTLVLTPLADGSVGVIPVYENWNSLELDKTATIQLVHSLEGAGSVDLAEISQADRRPQLIFEEVEFGEISELHTHHRGDFQYGLYEAGLIQQTAVDTQNDFNVADVERIASFDESNFLANTSTLYVVAPPLQNDLEGQHPELLHYVTDNRPRFGSPTSIGFSLFTTYMLPFQVIALLLLVAMIGAIVLTRDQITPTKKRLQRRLANTGDTVTGGDNGQ